MVYLGIEDILLLLCAKVPVAFRVQL